MQYNLQLKQFVNQMIARLMKEWCSPVYAFFEPKPHIIEHDGCRAHQFKSTGNMRKHVKLCWGDEVLQSADQAKDAQEVRTKIVGSILRSGSITTSFERKGKGKVTYSHRQHTRTETKGFQSLMKTGRFEYYLPSAATVSRDIWLEHEGKVNFTTDGWTSTNHRALVAVSAHLEHKGVPLSLPLDIVEIPKVRMTYFGLT
ncbi:hypothetical protein C8R48DRAFT_749732 [Suillus tomentosus]|nr:hypothetical protein C8R48DRAFT_749732 [Suillus tomentosus]